MEDYTFTGSKFLTKGIREDLPEDLINYLWMLIEKLKTDKNIALDYLQVFEIKPMNKYGKDNLSITHIQEVPPYKKIHLLENDIEVKGRVYIIDDRDRVTMLWANEY